MTFTCFHCYPRLLKSRNISFLKLNCYTTGGQHAWEVLPHMLKGNPYQPACGPCWDTHNFISISESLYPKALPVLKSSWVSSAADPKPKFSVAKPPLPLTAEGSHHHVLCKTYWRTQWDTGESTRTVTVGFHYWNNWLSWSMVRIYLCVITFYDLHNLSIWELFSSSINCKALHFQHVTPLITLARAGLEQTVRWWWAIYRQVFRGYYKLTFPRCWAFELASDG